jgi:D-alanyl-D-alanine carboxypeptidase
MGPGGRPGEGWWRTGTDPEESTVDVQPTLRRRLLAGAAALAAVVATGAALTAPAAQAGSPAHRPVPAVQSTLDSLVRDQGLPAALASVRGRDGRVRDYTAGVGDLRTGSRVPVDGRVRIGSNTKTFTAVVVLQLVGEGKVALDAPVRRYLPGLLERYGQDAGTTVRQLLQQTSGLPDYDQVVFAEPADLLRLRHTYFQPYQLVDAALSRPARFAPGTRWEYSNTNYIVAGLLAERVSGRPIGEEITRRVIEPLRLRDTYWPAAGDQRIAGRHPHGYLTLTPGTPYTDVTVLDPSAGWAAGQLIASPGDLRTVLEALIGGRLLRPAQLAEMEKTVDAPGFEVTDGWQYGLGIARHQLPCGGWAWGHGGDIQGFETRNLVTADGRGAVVAITALPPTEAAAKAVDDAVDTALCS